MNPPDAKRSLQAAARAALLLILVAAAAWVFAAPCLAAQGPAGSPGRGECQTVRSAILGESVPYCILLPPGYDARKNRRYPILYFLHGLGDNEQTFLRSGGWNMIQDLWQGRRLGEFLIVTPRGGSSFYINSRDGRRRYEDFFLREFIPAIEARYRVRPGRNSRGIAGISMGGYGALRMAFRHPGLFAVASAHSAALIEKLPAVSLSDSRLAGPLGLLGDVFGSPLDRAFFDANNPLTLARTADLSQLRIYFDCGTEDDFGFDAGAQRLHDVLLSRRVAHEFHLYPGGHNWLYFSRHLAASLEFDAHALGLLPAGSSAGH